MAARQQRQALILGTGHQHQRSTEIDIREGHVAFRGQADHPVAAILELLERTVQVHHPRHRQMLKRSGSHLGRGTGQPRTAALGQHDAMGAHRFRGSHHGAEVVRVCDTVEGHEQRRFTEVGTAADQGIEIQGFGRCRLQSDALVHRTAGDLTQSGPGDLLHQHTGCLGIAEQLQELGGTAHLRRAPDPMDRSSCLQCGKGGVASPDQIVRRWGGRRRLRLRRTEGRSPLVTAIITAWEASVTAADVAVTTPPIITGPHPAVGVARTTHPATVLAITVLAITVRAFNTLTFSTLTFNTLTVRVEPAGTEPVA